MTKLVLKPGLLTPRRPGTAGRAVGYILVLANSEQGELEGMRPGEHEVGVVWSGL